MNFDTQDPKTEPLRSSRELNVPRNLRKPLVPKAAFAVLMLASMATSFGCANRYQNALLGMGLVAQSPTNELEQTYYLGVFDPQGQVPLQMYRIRVHGQASLGSTKFASGWVPASVIDTLNLQAVDNESNVVGLGEQGESFLTGRNLVAFGPEGFREVPQNHRLVMIMGHKADEFFKAVSESLGAVSDAKHQIGTTEVNHELFQALNDLLREKLRLQSLATASEGNP